MLAAGIGPLTLALVLGFSLMAARATTFQAFRHLAGALAVVGAVALAVLVVLPWALVELPSALARAVSRLPGIPDKDAESGAADYVLPATGFLSVAAIAVRRFLGLALLRDHLPRWAWWPEWRRFVLVVVVLAVLRVASDAQSWSLHPFYKRRLSCAYLLERLEDGGVRPLPDRARVRLHDLRPPPHLVMCCAVNLSRWGETPPGRRAASFTSGEDHIGGP